jgi:hypothetical protein
MPPMSSIWIPGLGHLTVRNPARGHARERCGEADIRDQTPRPQEDTAARSAHPSPRITLSDEAAEKERALPPFGAASTLFATICSSAQKRRYGARRHRRHWLPGRLGGDGYRFQALIVPGGPAKHSRRGAADNNKIICRRGCRVRLGQMPVSHLNLDGDLIGKRAARLGGTRGKHQVDELGRPVAMRVAGIQIHVMDLRLAPSRPHRHPGPARRSAWTSRAARLIGKVAKCPPVKPSCPASSASSDVIQRT